MAKSQKRAIGDIGEEIACKYLISRGFSIIERNYWRPWGEIDIVAEKSDLLLFIEVKSISVSRGTEAQVRPEENMHPGKVQRLSRIIQTYLSEKRVPENMEWRVDLACVYLDFELKRGRVAMIEGVM